jgi:hypothetical protein
MYVCTISSHARMLLHNMPQWKEPRHMATNKSYAQLHTCRKGCVCGKHPARATCHGQRPSPCNNKTHKGCISICERAMLEEKVNHCAPHNGMIAKRLTCTGNKLASLSFENVVAMGPHGRQKVHRLRTPACTHRQHPFSA